MMRGVWPLLIESALILLQTVPTHIDVDVLKKKLLEDIDGVLAVHDFHVWQLTGDKIIASAHIRCINLSEYMKVRHYPVIYSRVQKSIENFVFRPKMAIFRRAGMREGGLPLPLAFQYLILMI